MNSSQNVTYSLEEQDYDDFKRNGIASMAYLVSLCIIGTVGNTHVILVYLLRFKTSVHQRLVLSLAGVDLVGCTFGIPASLFNIRHPYTIQSLPYCKIYRTIMYLIGTYSLFILAWIAVERYGQVCHAIRVKFTARITRIVCAVTCVLILVLIIIPVNIISGINRKTTQIHSLLGYECNVLDHFEGSTFSKAFMGYIFIFYVSFLIISAVMYILIWKKINATLNKRRTNVDEILSKTTFHEQETYQARSKSVPSKDCRNQDTKSRKHNISDENEFSTTAITCDSDEDVIRESCIAPTFPQDTVMEVSGTTARHNNQQQPQSSVTGIDYINTLARRDHRRQRQLERSKTVAFVFLVVSIISFGVYLPYQILTFITHLNSSLYMNFRNNYGALHTFIKNLFFLNHAINPFIYGLIDRRFRTELSNVYVNMKHSCYAFCARSKP